MTEHVKQILVDAFGRVRELRIDLTDGLTDDLATYRPDPGANSIAWLVWHLSRIQHDHVADWRRSSRCGRSGGKGWVAVRQVGYGLQSGSQGRSGCPSERRSPQRIPSGGSRSHSALSDGITAQELDRIVDTRWNPPVTASVRIVSVIGDTMQHLGQAAYVRGLAERRDSAWHQPGAADR